MAIQINSFAGFVAGGVVVVVVVDVIGVVVVIGVVIVIVVIVVVVAVAVAVVAIFAVVIRRINIMLLSLKFENRCLFDTTDVTSCDCLFTIHCHQI